MKNRHDIPPHIILYHIQSPYNPRILSPCPAKKKKSSTFWGIRGRANQAAAIESTKLPMPPAVSAAHGAPDAIRVRFDVGLGPINWGKINPAVMTRNTYRWVYNNDTEA